MTINCVCGLLLSPLTAKHCGNDIGVIEWSRRKLCGVEFTTADQLFQTLATEAAVLASGVTIEQSQLRIFPFKPSVDA